MSLRADRILVPSLAPTRKASSPQRLNWFPARWVVVFFEVGRKGAIHVEEAALEVAPVVCRKGNPIEGLALVREFVELLIATTSFTEQWIVCLAARAIPLGEISNDGIDEWRRVDHSSMGIRDAAEAGEELV